MHEFSLMEGVIDAVSESATANQAKKVTAVRLVIGDMAEVMEDSLRFAFEVLTEDTICAGATLEIKDVHPRSRCLACGCEFEHTRYKFACPECGSLATQLLAGRELYIDAIEIEK
jgi:hydrogenase nickel incorporation protein HypA/HybF